MTECEATAVYFGDDKRPLFGWLHRPRSGGPPRLAVVICNPFGHEALSSHRTLRELAQLCANDQMLALRFDYEGTGNSSGDTHDVPDGATWRANVLSALAFINKIVPAVPVALVGLRLGALIALNAAEHSGPLAALILIAPPKSGRQFLRELRALQATNPHVSSDDLPQLSGDSAGYAVSTELRAYIEALDLDGRPLASAARLYVVDREELPLGARLSMALESRQVTVEIRTLRGAADLLVEPHEVKPVDAILAQTLAWLDAVADATKSMAVASTISLPREPSAVIVTGNRGQRVREFPVFLDPGRRLFGILTEPVHLISPPRAALILVSSGAVPTVGPNRVYATLARRLAAEGIAVLRFDVAGIGDSDPHPGEPANTVYTRDAPSDVATAVSFVAARGFSKIIAGGICAGGYHALKAVVAGASLTGIAIINPLTFHYVEDMPLAAQPHLTIVEARRHRRSIRSAAAWRKLLTGKVGVGRTLGFRANMAQSWMMSHVRDALRHTRWRRADDVGYDFETLARRGVCLHFIFADDDPGPVLLADFGGSAARRLERAGSLKITTITGADHTFTARKDQRALGDAIATIFGIAQAHSQPEPDHASRHAFC